MKSPPFPRYLIPPRSKYFPQHHVFKHPQLPFLPQCQRPSFTPIQNKRKNYSSIYLDKSYIILSLYRVIRNDCRVLTTCHTQYTSDSSISIFFNSIEQHSQFMLHTLQLLYICTVCDSTNINTIIEFVPNCL